MKHKYIFTLILRVLVIYEGLGDNNPVLSENAANVNSSDINDAFSRLSELRPTQEDMVFFSKYEKENKELSLEYVGIVNSLKILVNQEPDVAIRKIRAIYEKLGVSQATIDYAIYQHLKQNATQNVYRQIKPQLFEFLYKSAVAGSKFALYDWCQAWLDYDLCSEEKLQELIRLLKKVPNDPNDLESLLCLCRLNMIFEKEEEIGMSVEESADVVYRNLQQWSVEHRYMNLALRKALYETGVAYLFMKGDPVYEERALELLAKDFKYSPDMPRMIVFKNIQLVDKDLSAEVNRLAKMRLDLVVNPNSFDGMCIMDFLKWFGRATEKDIEQWNREKFSVNDLVNLCSEIIDEKIGKEIYSSRKFLMNLYNSLSRYRTDKKEE